MYVFGALSIQEKALPVWAASSDAPERTGHALQHGAIKYSRGHKQGAKVKAKEVLERCLDGHIKAYGLQQQVPTGS